MFPTRALSLSLCLAALCCATPAHAFINACVSLPGLDTGFVGIGCEGALTGVLCTTENRGCASCECLGLSGGPGPTFEQSAAPGTSVIAVGAIIAGGAVFHWL